MKNKQQLLWGIIILGTVLLGAYVVKIALSLDYEAASGWWQVFLGIVGIPILYSELVRLRKAVEKKPALNIGIVNINDYPLSNVRIMKQLPTLVRVGKGYPYFAVAIRNTGTFPAKFVKIHLEFRRPDHIEGLARPTVKVYKNPEENDDGFQKDTNFDFMFIGGSDWVLYPNDTDIFPFIMSTTMIKETEPVEIRERPPLGDYYFHCTVWAEGLDIIQEDFIVSVVETIKGESR